MENNNNPVSVHVVDVPDQAEIKKKKVVTALIVVLAILSLTAAIVTGIRNQSDTPSDTTITLATTSGTLASSTAAPTTAEPTATATTAVPVVIPPTQSPTVPTSQTPVTDTTAPVDWRTTDPSSWTTEQVVTYYVEAVTLCRAYTGALTVNHSEQFEAEVLECTGGDMAKYVANKVVENMSKPTSDVYQYNGGTAVDGEGATIPLLLPLEGSCAIPPEGVKSATAVKNGDNIDIMIELNEESTTIDAKVPPVNSQCIGYLQLTEIYKYLDMTQLDIVYLGSSIAATVRPDGYIAAATYKIPLHTTAGGKKGPLTGTAVFTATQQEDWTLLWQ